MAYSLNMMVCHNVSILTAYCMVNMITKLPIMIVIPQHRIEVLTEHKIEDKHINT